MQTTQPLLFTINEPDALCALMASSQRGCRKSYSQLLGMFGEILSRWTSARALSGNEASQLINSVLRAVHEKLGTCDPNQPVLPWLLAIAEFRCRKGVSNAWTAPGFMAARTADRAERMAA